MSEISNQPQVNVSQSYNSESSFTLNSTLGANTNLNVYEQAYQYQNTNYLLYVNVGNMASMFSNASYSDYLNSVNVNLSVNKAWVTNNVWNSAVSSVLYRGGSGGSELTCGMEKLVYNNTSGEVISTQNTVGFRLLEIAAVNIFNNAKARAAIANDAEFVNGTIPEAISSDTLYNSLSNQLSTAFDTDKFNIFNQYVNTTRYNASVDSNEYTNFNFSDANIQVLLTFNTNTVGTPSGYTGSIGGLNTNVSKSVLLILTDTYDFANVQGPGRFTS